jgi:hypothetical protein
MSQIIINWGPLYLEDETHEEDFRSLSFYNNEKIEICTTKVTKELPEAV